MRRPALTLAAAALLVLTASTATACTAPAPDPTPTPTPDDLPVGSTVHTLEHDGVDRSYRVYVPTSVGDDPAPLVVMLHGGFGSAEQAELVYGWDRQAERYGLIVAYPEGVARSWNGDGCCGAADRRDLDDVGFATAVVDAIDQRREIDPQRVYAAGMSNGGMLAYRLACETGVFAAIGVVASTMLTDCDARAPVSVMHIHGARDRSIPPDGSPGEGTQQIDGPPLAEVLGYWREVDGCGPASAAPFGDPQVVALDPAGCAGGTSVVYVEILDAGHQWPGAPSSELREELGGDPPSRRLDATDVLAGFFLAHPRPAGDGSDEAGG